MKKLTQIGSVVLEWLIENIGNILGTIFFIACVVFVLWLFSSFLSYVEREQKRRASFTYQIHVVDDNTYYTHEYDINPTNNSITFYDGINSNRVTIVNQKVTVKTQHNQNK